MSSDRLTLSTSLSIVVPLHNEEENIQPLVASIFDALIPQSKFTLASYGDKLLLSNRSDQEQSSNHAEK